MHRSALALRRAVTPALSALLLAALPVLAPAQGGPVELRIRPKKGDVMRFAQTQKTSQAMQVMGQDMETGMDFTLEMTFTVKDVADDGAAVIGIVYDLAHGSMTAPMIGPMEFDTRKDVPADDEGIAKAMKAMMGKPFTMTVAPDGTIRRIEGLKEMFESLGGDEDAMGMAMMMKQLFSEQTMRKSLEQMFSHIPKEPVAMGGTWKHKNTVPLGQAAATTEMTNTLVSCDGKSAEITSKGTFSMGGAAESAPAGGGDDDEEDMASMMKSIMKAMRIEKSSLEGKTLVSCVDGFPLESQSKMLAEISITLPEEMAEQMGGESAMNISLDMGMTIRRIGTTTGGATESRPEPAAAESR